ncbi:hypothetical protein CAPTEDRAFT_197005 [Capitella teleta]|uniref:Polypeptide N-acetylgalactosaminyltransferase n=1 Tax=Capitella teleta TaxID=283909 RepID=R7V610_CAPTE|nr:hypothetical protein CAPTEDRAFT_197005 [Capitella teleta]|eukprot:ELU14019.1 hypothetical protein CAPTEDRAFT_197005 [Capitella teleta]
MRRNSISILKYLVLAALFLTLGPFLVKFMIPDDHDDIAPRGNAEGMPIEPGAVVRKSASDHESPEKSRADEPLQKIDWHDYKHIEIEKQRTGPGEQGAAVILSSDEEKKKDALYKVNGFNGFASDKISLQRSLKDIRHPQCRTQKYWNKLPTVSVVVPFHNEHWSTLLRTAESVLVRSPPELIHEIILVDDFSSKEHCGKPLDDHLATHYGGKVKVIHQPKREGLIRTRLAGAREATGDVLIFLDSHCEANVNWLPPLLDPIAEDYRTVVCPFIDVVDYETFAYRAQDEGARGAFDWEFFYKRLPLLPEDLKHPARPFKSPVMAGGLFAISAKWFWELGGYDPGLDIWGGEQYELSFKLWQCGGQMLDAPCSRVGHIYRKFAPFPNPGVGDFVGRNYRRVAEVWMDEYAEFLYKRRPQYRSIQPGNITEQLAIRKKLNCKPFKWFMEEIAFDLPKKYPPIEPPAVAEGEMRNVGANLCVDTRFKGQGETFGLEKCAKDEPGIGGEQRLQITWHKDIRPGKRSFCFDVSTSVEKAPVILYNCHGMKGNQWFKYDTETSQVFHPISRHCLDCDAERKEIFMSSCDKDSNTQKWKFEKVNLEQAKKDWLAKADDPN